MVSVAALVDEAPITNVPTNMSAISFFKNDEVNGKLFISVNGTDSDAGETMNFWFSN